MIPTTFAWETPLRTRTATAFLALATILAACGRSSSEDPSGPRPLEITTADGTIDVTVEVADTEGERERGLMGRTSLGDDRGMAFLWDEPVESSFWMKDTLIPLSVAFWNERGRIIRLDDMQPCRQDPCPTYGPDEPFVGALEVNLGFFEEHGVSVGDRVEISGDDET
jgi:uncharacterized protein